MKLLPISDCLCCILDFKMCLPIVWKRDYLTYSKSYNEFSIESSALEIGQHPPQLRKKEDSVLPTWVKTCPIHHSHTCGIQPYFIAQDQCMKAMCISCKNVA